MRLDGHNMLFAALDKKVFEDWKSGESLKQKQRTKIKKDSLKYFGLLVVCLAMLQLALAQEKMIQAYEEYGGTQSTQFEVFVDDQEIKVFDHSDSTYTELWNSFHYAHFAFVGAVEIKVVYNGAIENITISPRNKDFEIEQNGNTLSFVIDRPQKLMIWDSSDRMNHKLAIFAETVEDNIPDLSAENVVSVQDFENLQAAVNYCHEFLDNGIVFLPPGAYEGLNDMKSSVSIYLAPGSKIVSPIYGENIEHVKIWGRGAFDTGANTDAVRFEYSNDISLEGFITIDSGVAILFDSFRSHLYNLKNFRVSERAQTLDANGANDILVDNCFMFSADDALAIGFRHNQTNINIRNSLLGIWGTGTCLKVAASARINQVEPKYERIGSYTVENCNCMIADRLVQVRQDCGGDVEDFYFKNCTMEFPFTYDQKVMGMLYSSFNDEIATLGYGNIRRISLSNCEFPSGFIQLRGLDDIHQVSQVNIANTTVGGEVLTSIDQSGMLLNEYTSDISIDNSQESQTIQVRVDQLQSVEGDLENAFLIHREGDLSEMLNIDFALRGTATQGVDYEVSDTVIHFPAGVSSVALNIDVFEDGVNEGLETVHLILENEQLQSAWSLGYRSDAVMSIVDDVNTSVQEDYFSSIIYPNPSNGEFFFASPFPENVYISLYNSLGQAVPIYRDRERMKIKGQPDGHYHLRLDDGKFIQTVKLVLISN